MIGIDNVEEVDFWEDVLESKVDRYIVFPPIELVITSITQVDSFRSATNYFVVKTIDNTVSKV